MENRLTPKLSFAELALSELNRLVYALSSSDKLTHIQLSLIRLPKRCDLKACPFPIAEHYQVPICHSSSLRARCLERRLRLRLRGRSHTRISLPQARKDEDKVAEGHLVRFEELPSELTSETIQRLVAA